MKFNLFDENELGIPDKFRTQITKHTVDDDQETTEEIIELAQDECVKDLNIAVNGYKHRNRREESSYNTTQIDSYGEYHSSWIGTKSKTHLINESKKTSFS